MLSFKTETGGGSVFILVDDEGADDLIRLLQYVKDARESFHMIEGKELTNVDIGADLNAVKHVKLAHVGAFRD